MDKDAVTLIAAAGGWVVALVTLLLNYRQGQAVREEERLAKTLDYFDGGSQKRSIGISLLEGVWLKNPRYHSILAPLVANQIVYLILSTDSHDAHNERNLIRLLDIFAQIPSLRANYPDRWGDVCDAISRKWAGERKGIPLTRSTLQGWAKRLGHELK